MEIFEEALTAFRESIRAAITRVAVEQNDFDDFTELFAADFAAVLGGPRAVAVWRRDRTNITQLGRYLGTLAEMFAVTAEPRTTVGTEQLKGALKIIQPACKIGLPDGAKQQRMCYCCHVLP